MPKLQYQWSGPTWLVVHTHEQVCMLRSLTSSRGRKGDDVPLQPTNQKHIRIAHDRPVDFWIGARVRRRFSGSWFLGTVREVTTDEGETLYRVDYDDCDQEDLDKGQLWDAVIFHPRMCDMDWQENTMPELHSIVVFAHEQQPRLGKVTWVDEEAALPITLNLWKPQKNRRSLEKARFQPSSMNGEDDIIQLHPDQIKVSGLQFDTEGYLTPASQTKLRKYLTKHSLRQQSTKSAKSFRSPNSKTKGEKRTPALVLPLSSSTPVGTKLQKSHKYHLRPR